MIKIAATLLLLTIAGWVLLSGRAGSMLAGGKERALTGAERVATARKQRGDSIREKFTKIGVSYPARDLYLRAFKEEGELELWARNGAEPYRHVTTFSVLAASGKAGPKRREGDRQVPEGFYHIDRFNPESSYHLSLGLNYPNESDRVRSDKQRPGGDIFIHGKDVTIGCLPLGDEMIEELYLATLDARGAGQQRIPVHILPARMTGEKWERFQKTEAERDRSLPAFWRELQPVFDAFEKERRLPEISVAADGKYVISQPSGHA